VKHPLTLDQLFSFLEKQAFVLTDRQQKKLHNYYNLLKDYSTRINLISGRDVNHLAERHFLPCFWLCRQLEKRLNISVLDIGSGGGFPGVIIQIVFPDSHVVLLDSIRKKARFLEVTCERLELQAQVVCGRAEHYGKDSDSCFDIVVARAVAGIDRLWQWSQPLLKPGGSLMAMKGGACEDEFAWLREHGMPYQRLMPPQKWLLFSTYLNTKHIINLRY
jgi:16S rRNA (guanine527-N7)-methyltransferase